MSDEQRREAGCPARQAILLQRRQATSPTNGRRGCMPSIDRDYSVSGAAMDTPSDLTERSSRSRTPSFRRIQITFNFVGGGFVELVAIDACLGGQHLVSPLKRPNVLRGMRRIEESFAEGFATDACPCPIDQTPQRRAPHGRRWHDLEVLECSRVYEHVRQQERAREATGAQFTLAAGRAGRLAQGFVARTSRERASTSTREPGDPSARE